MEQILGSPPAFKPGRALDSLYNHYKVKKVVARSLRKRDFGILRDLRPLATAAEALDATSWAFTLKQAWPALKKTQDREVSVTPAVVSKGNAIQVMTIHAAKGLEFPVVLLMKLGKGGKKSFRNPNSSEDSRLVLYARRNSRKRLAHRRPYRDKSQKRPCPHSAKLWFPFIESRPSGSTCTFRLPQS